MKNSFKRAFSLIEILVTLSIVATLVVLLIPRFMELRRQAIVQTAKNEAAALQTAVNAWISTFELTDSGVAAFGAAGSPNTIDPLFFTTKTPKLTDYLDKSFITCPDGITPNIVVDTGDSSHQSFITTATLRQLTGKTLDPVADAVLLNFQGYSFPAFTTVSPEPIKDAHIVIFWPTNASTRKRSTPIVELFIPDPN